MKRLVLILRSAQTGGVESHVLDILKSAAGYGYSPVLISLTDIPVAPAFSELGIEIHTLSDSNKSSCRSIVNIYNLYRTLRSIRPDIVHLHGARPIFIGSLAARMCGYKNIISTLHGSYKLMAYDLFTAKINPLLHAVSKIVHATGFALSRRIIVDADALLWDMRDACRYLPISFRGIRKRTVTVHPCIDFSQSEAGLHNEIVRAQIGIDTNEVVVGYIGRVEEPMKGIRILLDAVCQLEREGVKFQTVIVGDGYSKDQLERYTESLGIAGRVRFLGFWKNLQDIYNMIDLFVLPSFSEGFPLVNLEAIENGIPVISTDVGGVSEAVFHMENGMVIPPRDIDALANALKKLVIDGNLRQEMGRRAHEISQERFRHKDMLNKIFELYDEVINSR